MNIETKSLFARLSQKDREKVEKLEKDFDLVDECKYMLYFKNHYSISGGIVSIPVRSITEAVRFVRYAEITK